MFKGKDSTETKWVEEWQKTPFSSFNSYIFMCFWDVFTFQSEKVFCWRKGNE